MVIHTDQPVTCHDVIGRASELAFLDSVLRDGARGVEAGFRKVQRVPMENPFNVLYGGPSLMSGELRFGMTFRRGSDWPSMVERVEGYEALGLDTMWIPDHFVFPWQPSSPWLECFSVLAALAARTSRIRVGSVVTHTVYRNPAILARTAMSVDQISGGRLELGLGLGLGSGASGYDWTMTSGAAPAPLAERVDRRRGGRNRGRAAAWNARHLHGPVFQRGRRGVGHWPAHAEDRGPLRRRLGD